jgi:hypothetical protein
VIARIIKPVVVVRQDVPSVVETLTAGAAVDFDLVEGVTESCAMERPTSLL